MRYCIIPARGGSKGVPRKNLRVVNGIPLVARAIVTARHVVEEVVVSTDDPDIAAVARAWDARVIDRPADLAADDVGVAEVVDHACFVLNYSEPVMVLQPTVALVDVKTLDDMRRRWTVEHRGQDLLVGVTPHRHLTWQLTEHEDLEPVSKHRLNRQQLSPLIWDEVGVFIRRPHTVFDVNRSRAYAIHESEAVDIDTHADLVAARLAAERRLVTFVITAGRRTGSGHIRRCLRLAEELAPHDIRFDFMGESEAWAKALLRDYEWRQWSSPNVAADVVVFDCLDTSVYHVAGCKANGSAVVCLEDLGPGSDLADVVINEMYDDPRPQALTGPRWAVLRGEFQGLPNEPPRETPARVLVTFGGTDPSGLTYRLGEPLVDLCRTLNVHLRVIPPPGGDPVELDEDEWKSAAVQPVSMLDEIRAADVVLTSCGRTVTEVAAVGRTVVTVAVNEREQRHRRLPGELHLGPQETVTGADVTNAIGMLLIDGAQRVERACRLREQVDGKGARRVARVIENMMEGL